MISHYLNRFTHLRTDASPAHWSEATRHRAPHKPLLLLAVMDLFAQGNISTPVGGPTNESLWPDLQALSWHRRNVFRRR